MARTKKKKITTMGYFRPFFDADPSLLDTKSNEALINQWINDHPHHTNLDLKRAKQNLANLKSTLRRQGRGESGGGFKASTRPDVTGDLPLRFDNPPTLEVLEECIDECLIMAVNLDRSGLGDVIKHLRLARNGVVWKRG